MSSLTKRCARCSKQVYPTEEIKCLDKVWHRGCFKCTVCGMSLSMKSYKGYDKMPYCSVHYPTQRHTVVTDNPEFLRLKENTKIQSNVKYHEEFEKNKGKYTIVPDDPETLRVMEHQKVVSQVEYRGLKPHRSANATETWSSKDNRSSEISSSSTPLVRDASESPKTFQSMTNNISARRVGSIADYDPLSGDYGSLAKGYQPCSKSHTQTPYEPTKANYECKVENPKDDRMENVMDKIDDRFKTFSLNHRQNEQKIPIHKTMSKRFDVRALYDYNAADEDELTFHEGDVILDCEYIDSGWMIGTHSVTRQTGMLPANYVKKTK